MAQLICKELCIGYEGKALVNNLDFEVSQGDYLCIVGENGAGKSTLLKTLLGLIQPLSGSISTADGLEKTEIGYLPQQTQVQRDFPATVREIVLSGFCGKNGIKPFYSKQQRKLADENIRRMALEDLTGRCYRELSGGQQQRVLLARALCATQKMLILDEPTAGLDPKVTSQLYQLISQLNNEGITVIMITHDIESSLRFATHILHIGSKVFFGTKEQYLESGAFKSFGLNGGESNAD